MKIISNFVVATCSVFLLTQCASQDEIRDLQYQLRTVNQKVEDVKTNTVTPMQKRQASSVSKIDQVEDETHRIKTTIEESTSQSIQFREQTKENIANLQKAVDAIRNSNDAKFSEINQKIAVLDEKLTQVSDHFGKAQQARISEAEKRAQEAAKKAEEAKQRAAAASSATTATSAAASSSTAGGMKVVNPSTKKTKVTGTTPVVEATPAPKKSIDQPVTPSKPNVQQPVVATVQKNTDSGSAPPASDPFSQGMNQYKSKNYKEAYKSFEQNLSANPKGSQAAKTLFYMGESLYSQGEYDLAILDYQKVISNHGSDALAPSALLKQGMSFEKLTDQETAKIIYKKLISDHGSSAEAAQAKERLGKL